MMCIRVLAAAMLAAAVSACTSAPSPVAPLEGRAPIDTRALLDTVHREARSLGAHGIEVAPLQDAERAHRLDQVRSHRDRGDLDQARAAAAAALAEAPADPVLLQEAAELALLAGDWPQAVELAGRSYEVGPRVGELCRRNWLTIAAARAALAGADEVALERLAQCSPPPPVRM